MKKVLSLLFFLIIVIAILWIGSFYWKNLRGIGPALEQPPVDITQVINATGMPLALPEGFSISIFAKDLDKPRVLAWDPAGNLLVSIPSQGRVVALLPDSDGDGMADAAVNIIENLNRPHGLAFRCREKCELYIAETDQVAVYDYDEKNLSAANKRKIIDLPGGGNHFTRTIIFMPAPNEDKLLISVGSTCNACEEEDWRRAKILIANYDGSGLKEFAGGLRNSVFMAIHPVTGKIWATEMGRDLLGDDLPPDEINIVEEGKNYGWPYCYGNGRATCGESAATSSHIDIPAHSAPLGLAFIPEEGWPEDFWHNLLVAYHGSWNRTVPTGYKVVRYKLDERGNFLEAEDFISGWLAKDGAIGRPVDILIQPGGQMYISDDKAGVIYYVRNDREYR